MSTKSMLSTFLTCFLLINICQSIPNLLIKDQTLEDILRGDPTPPQPTSESYYEVPIDHNDASPDRKTFKMKVLHYDALAKDDGPIFFYAGNEGPIGSFYNNTGLPFDWAKEFGAEIIFAEHRYYGSTLPFGEDSFKNENLKYLRVEQVMNDYAKFMADYNKNGKKKVMVLGGSYGGVLAAFLRMKFPTIFDMAFAASAPIPQIFYETDPSLFYKSITDDARNANSECPAKVTEAFTKIEQMFKENSDDSLKKLKETFQLCDDLKANEWDHFMQYARNAWTEMAMCDYPYPSSFLAPLPGNPIKAACDKVTSNEDIIQGLANAIKMPYAMNENKCYDMYTVFVECADQTGCGTGADSSAWDYQVCTDITLIVSSNNKTDMFPQKKWDLETLTDYCQKTYGVKPDPEGMKVRLGAYLQKEKGAQAYSNIIFSNGMLDPWHLGGFLENISHSLIAVKIPSGAHHLDLRLKNPEDPEDVIKARLIEKKYAKKWLGVSDNKSYVGDI